MTEKQKYIYKKANEISNAVFFGMDRRTGYYSVPSEDFPFLAMQYFSFLMYDGIYGIPNLNFGNVDFQELYRQYLQGDDDEQDEAMELFYYMDTLGRSVIEDIGAVLLDHYTWQDAFSERKKKEPLTDEQLLCLKELDCLNLKKVKNKLIKTLESYYDKCYVDEMYGEMIVYRLPEIVSRFEAHPERFQLSKEDMPIVNNMITYLKEEPPVWRWLSGEHDVITGTCEFVHITSMGISDGSGACVGLEEVNVAYAMYHHLLVDMLAEAEKPQVLALSDVEEAKPDNMVKKKKKGLELVK